MRIAMLTPLILLVTASAAQTADETAPSAPTIQFHIQGQHVGDDARPAVLRLGLELLKSSNFNTVNEAQLLGQSVPVIQDHYRLAVRADYMLIRYDRPMTVKTLSGDVAVYDILIGLARPDYVSALFAVDDQGRIVAFEKYSGPLAIELRQAVAANTN